MKRGGTRNCDHLGGRAAELGTQREHRAELEVELEAESARRVGEEEQKQSDDP